MSGSARRGADVSPARNMGKMPMQRYDIVVVGGGPAGLAVAIAAAEAGCRSVAVVERKRRWGRPIQCAEFVPKLIGQIASLEREAIVQSVKGLQFHFNGQPIGFLRAPGYVLDRPRFETALAEHAGELGVSFWQPAQVRAIAGDGLLLRKDGNEHELEARVVVGADGPSSLVRRVVSDEPMEFACALQHVLPLAESCDVAHVYLDTRYGVGYGWCFPRGREANVGLALAHDRKKELRAALDELVDSLIAAGLIAGKQPVRRVGGLVPVCGPIAQTAIGSILLAGDAAGQIHPLTGAGILTACACGRLAGETVARAINEENPDLLFEYETRWRDMYGDYFTRGLDARAKLLQAKPDTFLAAARTAWHLRTD